MKSKPSIWNNRNLQSKQLLETAENSTDANGIALRIE
jgi:hypothetical protein